MNPLPTMKTCNDKLAQSSTSMFEISAYDCCSSSSALSEPPSEINTPEFDDMIADFPDAEKFVMNTAISSESATIPHVMQPRMKDITAQTHSELDWNYPAAGTSPKNHFNAVISLLSKKRESLDKTGRTNSALTAGIKKQRTVYTKTVLASNLQEQKPPGIRLPDIWCETRQELCESLAYYRAYQSGCYTHDGLVHGYLLDSCASIRDHIGGKIVISHCGGKSKDEEGTGIRTLKNSQTKADLTVKALLNNMNLKVPVALIIGNKATKSPTIIPYRYCVMGYFKVTHAWAELCPASKFVRYKFRFEKLDFGIDGWWAAEQTKGKDREQNEHMVITWACCLSCRRDSPQVYNDGWMCLEAGCTFFWKLNSGQEPVMLSYTPEFLNAKTYWEPEYEVPPTPLKPVVNVEWDEIFYAQDVTRRAWKGFYCDKCGRLSCREFWDRWQCANTRCNNTVYPKTRPMFTSSQLADPHRPLYTGPAIPENKYTGNIRCSRSVRDGFSMFEYQLGNCGTVTHILSNDIINAREMDANYLLENYQKASLPFRRYSLHTQQGITRCSHFTYNVGAQYNYVAGQPTVTFEEAAPVIRHALEIIKQRVCLVYPSAKFNEVLNVGYFENQKMNYHQDSEKGLGPTVASISLGCPALMKFRIKMPRNLQSAEQKAEENMEEKLGSVERGVQLTLRLNHGDVMIMHGADLQKYWEHAAQPVGLFRIAATARWIGSENQLINTNKPPAYRPLPKFEPREASNMPIKFKAWAPVNDGNPNRHIRFSP